MSDRIETISKEIERLTAENMKLFNEYFGVRPSWVSSDMARNGSLIASYKHELEILNGDS